MRTQEFDKVKPYCYYIRRKSDGMQYFGVRWSNISSNRTPKNDLWKRYFSSRPSLRKEIIKNKDNFIFKFVYTFSTIEEARDYELRFNKKILKHKSWLNTSAFPQIIHTEEAKQRIRNYHLGRKLSKKTRMKISKAGTGRKHSEESLKKMSMAQLGEKHWNYGKTGTQHHFFGKHHSKKTRKKLKKTSSENWKNQEFRKRVTGNMKGRIPWNKNKTNIYSAGVLRKMSKAKKGKPSPHKGKKRPEEFRQKLRKAWIERRKMGVSEETRRKLSKAFSGKNHPMYGLKGKTNPNFGRKNTPQAKYKMSISAKLSWNDERRIKAKGKSAWKGRNHLKETKKKISESLKKRYLLNNLSNVRLHNERRLNV